MSSWNELLSLAEAEIGQTLQALPAHLREAAKKLPVVCERLPSDELIEDGVEPDTLGLFVGEAYADEEMGTMPLPAQIFLFLDNIWDFAEADKEVFREEIRTTYLHELGHYLGLDEIDLEERGLD